MKRIIGILSMQKVINYGSFLQAYALKNTLNNLGVDKVTFIDIKAGRILPGLEVGTKKEKISRFLGIIKKVLTKSPKKTKELIRYRKEYPKSIKNCWKLLGIDKPESENNYDLIVIGSDEVFNCCNASDWGFSPQLFGEVKPLVPVVSYAASFGSTTVDQIRKYNLESEIARLLSNFKYISVRDNNSFKIVKYLTKKNPLIHIDPVLLYNFQKEIEEYEEIPLSNYIIVYTYPGRIKDKNEIQAITDFAKKYDKKICTIMCSYDWAEELIVPNSPFGVLKWFKMADFVITDTFHGTIFSIITKRQFATLIRESNMNKISSLLELFDLKQSATSDTLEQILTTSINYSIVDNKLSRLRLDAEEYLKTVIQ